MKLYIKYWRWLRVLPCYMLALLYFYCDQGSLVATDAFFLVFWCFPFMVISGMFRTAVLYFLGHKKLVWKGQNKSWVRFKVTIWILLAFFFLRVFSPLLNGERSFDRSGQLIVATGIFLALIGTLNAYAVWVNAKEKD